MAFTKVSLTGTIDTIKQAFTAVNNIIDDLLSTASGKGASQIGVQDSADNMAADNVEDALAEIYTDVSSSRTALDTLDENSSTTTGLTWGYKGGLIRFDNTVTTVTAGTISLTDDDTNYVEINDSGTVSRNTTGFTSGRIPLRQIVTSGGSQSTSTDKRAWFQAWDIPLPVTKGGTGVATLTDHGILLGSGTSNITPLGAATNGQLPIGKTGADPELGTITATANETTVANGAASITIGIANDVVIPTSITIPNTGLHILDSNASHVLIIKPGSDLSADRQLTITTGDAARTITLSDDLSVPANANFIPAGTKMYFYQNTAPTGWTIDETPADAVLAVKGGSNAYNVDGGNQAGTWTQPNHTHTGPSHTHTGPSHNHKWYDENAKSSSDTTYDSSGSGVLFSDSGAKDGAATAIDVGGDHSIHIEGDEEMYAYTNNAGTGATGAAGTGATGGSATANTYRPLAQVGIIATKD